MIKVYIYLSLSDALLNIIKKCATSWCNGVTPHEMICVNTE